MINEILILLRCQQRFGIEVSHIVAQLIAAENRGEPFTPPMPVWRVFEWPKSGEVRFKYND